jgi:mono/diheme cytochrome c family protein
MDALRLSGIVAACAFVLAVEKPSRADETDFTQVERGRYLARLGDCVACHTADPAKPFAGGVPLKTPFGTIYGSNLTPDPVNGLGAWTREDFQRAMREGVAPGGRHLYPAFPYPWFTKATREDVDALWAYLRTLELIPYRPPDPEFPWPISVRGSMAAWNALFFEEGDFKPDPDKSDAWNRGAYIVRSLGHCGACHTPRNILGAVDRGSSLEGATIEQWYAPSLGGDLRTGLGDWTQEAIATYLKTGRNDRAVAAGPMAQVVEDSTQHLTDQDLQAIALYLKDQPDASAEGGKPARPDRAMLVAGEHLYRDDCSGCHRPNGKGINDLVPSLAGDAVVQSRDPTGVVRIILHGGYGPATAEELTRPAMPPFGWKLDDQGVAAVATFVRNAWGNRAAAVGSDSVAGLRAAPSPAPPPDR